MFELEVKKREETGKRDIASIRADGLIPGVVYGNKEEVTSVKLNLHTFTKTLRDAGESTIITLKGLGKDKDVLIQSVDFEPVKGTPLHVDFYAINKDEKITVWVPLEFIGESAAVKSMGGVLVKVMHEMEVEVLPANLPSHIDIDISPIKDFETSIHVRDIKLPVGVVALASPEEVIALANEAVEESFDEPAVGPDMDSIEVQEKGKAAVEGKEAEA